VNQFQLRGRNLEDLKAQILAEHGPAARLVSAAKVTQGGLGGFLAKRFFEVVVDVPDRPAPARHVGEEREARGGDGVQRTNGVHRVDTVDTVDRVEVDTGESALVGIAALLADADAAEAEDQPWHGSPGSVSAGELSTNGPRVDAVVAGVDALLARHGGRWAVPAPTRSAGDLTLLVGLGSDALVVARAMAAVDERGDVKAGGRVTLPDTEPVVDRRSAHNARADAVLRGRPLFVAFGLGARGGLVDVPGLVASLGADQVWAVVDPGRKADDTERWVRDLAAIVDITALAVVDSGRTATPQTVNRLGFPLGWVDGMPAVRPEL
jgi:hypothetical protein